MPIWLVRTFRAMRVRRMFSVLFVLTLLAISLLGNALTFYFFEDQEGLTFGDALWYSVISITTIGYGDYSATTTVSRLGTVVFIVLFGLATFSVIMSIGIDWVGEIIEKGKTGMSEIHAKDHIIIVNFPSTARVMELIEELKSHPDHEAREIVIVTDQVERLPFDDKNVLFVRGPVLEQESYLRAKVQDARMVIVLATGYGDPNSDAVVASSVAVVESLNRDVYSVAECLNFKHRMLFDSVNTNALVYSMRVTGNLLSLEAHDRGVSQLVNQMTSSRRGEATLYSAHVDSASDQIRYREMAKTLLDKDIHLLGVQRDEESVITFGDLTPQKGDHVLYVSKHRVDWKTLCDGS